MLPHDHTVMLPVSLLFLAACLSLLNARWARTLTITTLACTMAACASALAQDDAPQQVVLSTGGNVVPLDGLGFGGGIAVAGYWIKEGMVSIANAIKEASTVADRAVRTADTAVTTWVARRP
jgi:hypothetical protein